MTSGSNFVELKLIYLASTNDLPNVTDFCEWY